MTEEERTALKAEIVAELGQHLDEHYVKSRGLDHRLRKLVDTLVGENVQQLSAAASTLLHSTVGPILERVRDLEMYVSLSDIHRRSEPTDGERWMFTASMRNSYAKTIRKRVAAWFKESTEKRGMAGVPVGLRNRIPKLMDLFAPDGD